jgi:hypothetical protein
MTAPMAELLSNECVVATKKHELHIRIHMKNVAILSFQSGAGQDCVLPRGERLLDLLAQTFQPRPSVFVRQRMTAAHLLDICCRMKIVAFKKMSAEFAREQFAHCGFPSTGDSEDDYNHDALIC